VPVLPDSSDGQGGEAAQSVDWTKLASDAAQNKAGAFGAIGSAIGTAISPGIGTVIGNAVGYLASMLNIKGRTQHLSYDEAFPTAHPQAATDAAKILAKIPAARRSEFANLYSLRAVDFIFASPRWNQTGAQLSNKKIYTDGIRENAWPLLDPQEKLRITLENIYLWVMTAVPTDRPQEGQVVIVEFLTDLTKQVGSEMDSKSVPGGVVSDDIGITATEGLGVLVLAGLVFLLWKVFHG
jgi:hypothetical protein